GALLQAAGVSPTSDSADAMVRPENVAVGQPTSQSEQVVMPAVVSDFINLGDFFEVTVDVEGVGSVHSKMLAEAPVPFAVGERTSISIPKDGVLLVRP